MLYITVTLKIVKAHFDSQESIASLKTSMSKKDDILIKVVRSVV